MKLLRHFVAFLWAAAHWQVLWTILLSTLLSFTEGISLAMIFPVIALLGDPARSTSAGKHTQMLFHLLAATHLPQSAWLPTILLAIVVIVGLLAQGNGVFATLSLGIILRVRLKLAEELYRALLHADWSFLTARRSSDLTHLLTEELNRIGSLASHVISFFANAMVAVLMLAIAAYIAPQLTLLVLLCLALLVPLQRRSSRAIHALGDEQSLHSQAVFASAMERLQNLKVVKAFGAQRTELDLFSARYGGAMDALLRGEWRRNAAARKFQLLSLAVLCGVIVCGLSVFHLAAGSILLFLFAFVRVTPRINNMQSKSNEIVGELPAYRHTVNFLAECSAHSEASEKDQPGVVNRAPVEVRASLQLQRVTFAYPGLTRTILDDLSLVFPAGSITAIAGFSGAGKSTIADLVMGLLHPQSGRILVDGVLITRDNARSWRRSVGYVSQDTFLFHASIRENLLWAKPKASQAELAAALEAASGQFVWALSQGIETIVGDRGIMLSHGQRQRIALARALLLHPALLILDEATNSLDLENEENILQTVRARGQTLTTLLISHRPSALQFADFIFVLDAGKVKASGTWEQVRSGFDSQAGASGPLAARGASGSPAAEPGVAS